MNDLSLLRRSVNLDKYTKLANKLIPDKFTAQALATKAADDGLSESAFKNIIDKHTTKQLKENSDQIVTNAGIKQAEELNDLLKGVSEEDVSKTLTPLIIKNGKIDLSQLINTLKNTDQFDEDVIRKLGTFLDNSILDDGTKKAINVMLIGKDIPGIINYMKKGSFKNQLSRATNIPLSTWDVIYNSENIWNSFKTILEYAAKSPVAQLGIASLFLYFIVKIGLLGDLAKATSAVLTEAVGVGGELAKSVANAGGGIIGGVFGKIWWVILILFALGIIGYIVYRSI